MHVERMGSIWGAALLLWLFSLPAWAGLEIQHWHTPQGARVLLVQNHSLPMLDISVDFDAGSARDTPDLPGLANLTRHMMAFGAGPYNERELAEALADIGAVFSGGLDADRASFRLRTLSAEAARQRAAELLAIGLSQPRFEADILAREQARLAANLREARTRPEVVGEQAFAAAIFGDHPYALPEGGTPEGVLRAQRADLVAFHQRHYRAPAMTIALMGDISRAEAERLAERLAAGLPAGEAAPPIAPVPVAPVGSERIIPHHASQSHLFMGLPGMRRSDPDFFPLLVGNYVLGAGGFDSRLMQTVRQRQGLAYSVHSAFLPMREAGAFQIGLQTQRANTDTALRSVREVVQEFVTHGPSEAELVQAKNNIIGGFPLRLDSNRKILEFLAMIGFYRLPLDWLDTYTARVEAVTREEVMHAFRTRVPPGALHTVIVGGQLATGAP